MSMTILDMLVDGSLSSAVATLVSNPFDVMRTRMQLQGELQKSGSYEVRYRNLAQGMCRVVKEEGFLGLQKGLAPAVLWQVTQNGIRIGLYPETKRRLRVAAGGARDGGDTFVVCAGASMLCGLIGSYVASPFNMVKTRLQAQYGRSAMQLPGGAPHEGYAGVWDALSRIARANGVRGLWQGSCIAAQRTIMMSLSQLTSYDYAKRYAARGTGLPLGDVRVHILASLMASFCIVAVMNPLEVVLTRVYNQRGGPRVYSSNLPVATFQVYRIEGVRGLYKGCVPYFTRTAPHTIVTFVVLEELHKLRAWRAKSAMPE